MCLNCSTIKILVGSFKKQAMTLVLEFAVKTVAGTSQIRFNFKKVLSTNLIYVLHRLKPHLCWKAPMPTKYESGNN